MPCCLCCDAVPRCLFHLVKARAKLTDLPTIQILNEIGGLYFSLPPPRSPGGNPMADMMSSLFGGGAPQAQPARRQLAPALPAAAITQELD